MGSKVSPATSVVGSGSVLSSVRVQYEAFFGCAYPYDTKVASESTDKGH